MAKYALVQDSTQEVLKVVEGDREFRTGTPPDLPRKDMTWLPYVEVNPSCDNTQVKEGPVDVVTATEVTRTFTVRAKTAQELDAEKNAETVGLFKNKVLRALIISLDKGTFVPGARVGGAEIRRILKDEM